MNRLEEVIKTDMWRVLAAKEEIASRIIGKFVNSSEIVVIQQDDPKLIASVVTYYHIPTKTKLASLTLTHIGAHINIEKWINDQVL
ncbi:hypothetical protein [Acinetobacter baumannii]|uniref:hypothetical protein n=1 Tax=Acinetobacter baumannii TaxID=470 RepID=UPI00233FC9EB|nr:hypothetical protein [Acinetobacter baumannii]MDC4974779.1 hypothetical protein [Acinetobacter baumannii]